MMIADPTIMATTFVFVCGGIGAKVEDCRRNIASRRLLQAGHFCGSTDGPPRDYGSRLIGVAFCHIRHVASRQTSARQHLGPPRVIVAKSKTEICDFGDGWLIFLF
jgi:hypothetical protein